MTRKRVYIAGPLVVGDIRAHIAAACAAGLTLIKAGLSPFVPHTSCYWGQKTWMESPDIQHGPYPELLPGETVVENWYEADLAWVEVADALLRLPGYGKGSDAEVAHAKANGIPVFFSVASVLEWAVSE